MVSSKATVEIADLLANHHREFVKEGQHLSSVKPIGAFKPLRKSLLPCRQAHHGRSEEISSQFHRSWLPHIRPGVHKLLVLHMEPGFHQGLCQVRRQVVELAHLLQGHLLAKPPQGCDLR